jgi:hypothetical protein
MVQTSDGGYALAGMGMFIIVGDIGFWLVKTNSTGDEQWNRSYISDQMNVNLGGANALVQTADGGYALVGSVYNLTYLVKTDSEGNLQWRQAYGGIADVSSLIQTSDGGFMMLGSTGSNCWLGKINATGQIELNQTFFYGGGPSEGMSMVQTSDGGLAILVLVNPYTSESQPWLMRMDSSGHMLWTKTLGDFWGTFEANLLIATNDGGFLIAGSSNAGICVIKTDSDGNVLWNQTYSQLGSIDDVVNALIQTSDGGYALGCGAHGPVSVTGNLVKMDSVGNLQWNMPVNGAVCSVVQTSDGEYTIAGNINATTNFMLSTEATSPSLSASSTRQIPLPTVTPLQFPQSTLSRASTSVQPKNNQANNYAGYYLVVAAAIAVALLIVIAIATMLRRSNDWLPSRNLHVNDTGEQDDSP